MMIPIDAMTNLGFEDHARKLIDQVKPPIVIPMHYDRCATGANCSRRLPRSIIPSVNDRRSQSLH